MNYNTDSSTTGRGVTKFFLYKASYKTKESKSYSEYHLMISELLCRNINFSHSK